MYLRSRITLLLVLCLSVALAGCAFDDQLQAHENLLFAISGGIVGPDISLNNIQVKIGEKLTATDEEGEFILEDLPPGKYVIQPVHHYWQFDPESISVVVNKGSITDIKFSVRSPGTIAMVALEGGTFTMGTDDGYGGEKPPHQVTIDGFEIGKFEVTQKQWKQVTGTNPSAFRGDDRPVENISWNDIVGFCNQLSELEGRTPVYVIDGSKVTCDFTADGYRLPTEAEWEYACRGGTTTDRYSGDRSIPLPLVGNRPCFEESNLALIGWYCNNGDSMSHQVGSKMPNAFGLYDMQGNVTEWCWDLRRVYSASAETNPRGGSAGVRRILRGGSWFDSPHEVYSAFRREYAPGLKFSGVGFRVARSIP